MTHTKAAIEELGIILAEPSSTFPVATSEPFSASLLPDLPQESLTGFLLGTRNSAMPNYSESPRAFASKVIRLLHNQVVLHLGHPFYIVSKLYCLAGPIR
jgi:hypothetical protein